MLIGSFLPVIDVNSRVLILGSMPSKISLEKSQYYANPKNQFWKLIYFIFDEEPDKTYEEKIEFLRSKEIALWDVIRECSRKGSLDSAIEEEMPNDFNDLFQRYSNIHLILFNGTKAEKSFLKAVFLDSTVQEKLTFKLLPSSSPANATKAEVKREAWKVIRTYLEGPIAR